MIAAHSTKQFQENSFAFNIKKKKNEISAQNESKPHSGKKNHCADKSEEQRRKKKNYDDAQALHLIGRSISRWPIAEEGT